jgi:hypothetical protein
VIRYNYIETASGWMIDLVEPQESYATLGSKPSYTQAFVYGNILVNKGNYDPNYVHWNEDHQANQGRATIPGKLFFYNNTIITVANQTDLATFSLFNTTWGGYECRAGTLPGVIDVRNNLIATLPRTAGAATPSMKFGFCTYENFDFGKNWVSPGWTVGANGIVTGTGNIVSPASNNPGFVNAAGDDFHLSSGASVLGIGGTLASEVTTNALSQDLTPVLQYVYHQQVGPRATSGLGSDLGALVFGTGTATPVAPTNVRIIR